MNRKNAALPTSPCKVEEAALLSLHFSARPFSHTFRHWGLVIGVSVGGAKHVRGVWSGRKM